MIFKSFLQFFNQCISHEEKTMLNCIARIICLNKSTTTGANLCKMWLEIGVNPFKPTRENVVGSMFYHNIHNQELDKIIVIKELTDVKYGRMIYIENK